MKTALRTQQIILEESGATNAIDALGGSYFVEPLTERIEVGAREYLEQIDALGGTVAAVEAASSSGRSPTRPTATSAGRTRRLPVVG